MGLKFDGYVRVSRIGGRSGEGYISPAEQREAIEAYAADLGGEIVAWHDDQDYSGGNTQRPGFQAMLERVRSGESDGVVVKQIDRFARSVPDGSAIVREIVDGGAVFASCTERMDPKTREGRYMLNSFFNNAELFLNRIKAGWWTAKAKAVARGAHIGPTPIGYERIPKGEERPGCLVPHPLYGPAMSDLFGRAAGGADGHTALARWMTERAPREGGAPWQPSEVRRWLSNRVYLGEVRYGELVNSSAHEPLTDEETWQRCHREPGKTWRAHSRFLLAGLVRCANCRYAMGGQTYGGAKGATPIYRCNGRRCSEPSVITGVRLEGFLRDLVLERVRGLQLEAADNGSDLDAAERELAQAEAELDAFVADLNARRLLGEAGWQRGLATRAAERDAKRQDRDEVFRASELVVVDQDVERLDHDGLRDLLRGMVRHVFVRRQPRGAPVENRTLVIWTDDERTIDVPGPRRAGPFEPVRW